ncbi:TPA: hypothetical protein HA244_05005 [Candidatus Micrarchaeota archaeon]|nr:hypothetical protein [Candidatus Micrarchaeota archaeon]
MRFISKLIVIVLLSIVMLGCVEQATPTPAPTASQPELPFPTGLASPSPSLQPKTGLDVVSENMLLGLNSTNYSVFSQDFSVRFKAVMTETQFPKVRGQIVNIVGYYASSGLGSYYTAGGFIFFSVPARFENDEVNTTLIINKTTREIEGVAFDSPLLAQAQKPKITTIDRNGSSLP